MLIKEDPCEGCLVHVICEQMCPKAIKFYSNRVRKRTKYEVEQATGYYWEDDYIDDQTGKVINIGGATWKFKKEKSKINHVKNNPGALKKIINFIEKLKKGS